MKKNYSSALALGLLMASSVQAAPVQYSGNGHWYEYVGSNLSWDQAKDAAANSTYSGMSGHLATISDMGENNFVTNLGSNGWLGGTDEGHNGTWTWVTGEAWSFDSWSPGEPNDYFGYASENWIHTYASTWNDAPINWVGNYFIEYEPTSVAQTPIPAAVWLFGSALTGLVGLGKRKGKQSIAA